MKSTKGFRLVVLLPFVLLVACGGGQVAAGDASELVLGSCPEDAGGDRMPAVDLIAEIAMVMVAGTDALSAAVQEAESKDDRLWIQTASIGDGELVKGRSPFDVESIVLARLTQPDFRNLPSGWTAVNGLIDTAGLSGRTGGGMITVTVLVSDDGVLAFAGPCAESQYGELIRTYMAEKADGRDPVDMAVALMTDAMELETFSAWSTAPPEREWTDSEPAVRILDVEETPPEYLAELSTFSAAVTVPEDWTRQDLVLCSRVPDGWNECVSLLGLGEQGLTGIDLGGWVRAGDAIEFWLLDSTADTTFPLAPVGSVSTEGLDKMSFPAKFASPSVESDDDLVTAGNSGLIELATG